MARRAQARDGLTIVEQVSGDAVMLSAAGTIDMVTAPQFRQRIDTVLKRRPPALIIDLRRLEFLASAGIAVLMQIQNEADDLAFALVAQGPATARPLHLLGIDNLIPIFSTVGDAIQGLGVIGEETG